ncbi:hypothetical protein MSG28_008776 [Choristoneura fumiferana]|uniref:Uncharacterized protein n=1 Tax=Choristoneura fumiferana TaxID=7141 RepID=A0ACC0J7Z6_CHOFU|nr:hypothetical protein MSG28_008776 [Choristoneura fumiferana]
MSILFNNKNNIYIDHCKNISNIYQNISFGGVTEPYEFNKKLFYICRDTKVSSRKRKFANDELQKECSEVKAMYEQFLAEIPITLKTKCKMQTQSPCNTSDVRNLAQNLFESTVFDHKGISGGNNSDTALKSTIKNETFLIPPNSRSQRIWTLQEKCLMNVAMESSNEAGIVIQVHSSLEKKAIFTIIISAKRRHCRTESSPINLQLLWLEAACIHSEPAALTMLSIHLVDGEREGPHDTNFGAGIIRRTRRLQLALLILFSNRRLPAPCKPRQLAYSMMYNEDIAAIPVKNLLAQNCLIAIWCTNAPSNIAAVKDLIFTQWGVEYVTTWYWMKVTTDLEPLCDFGTGCKKQPYERIILGKVGDVNVPKKQLVVSVPSALHSHKPPLLDLLSPYLKVRNPQTLELFARYLLPNTTSVGYEPLKWQHISLYDKVI